MKRLIFTLIISVIAIVYFYPANKITLLQKQSTHPALVEKKLDEVLPYRNKKFATQKLKELTIANEQCRELNLEFSEKVSNIHQVLIQVLENELRQDKTDKELMGYANQYKTFYKSYQGLLLEAKLNIEKEKYRFTTSTNILNDWHGISVIDGFSLISTPLIVKALKVFEGTHLGISMNLALSKNISKSEVYELLENRETFNTYLTSPLRIANSHVISPSILFVLTARQLSIDEFKTAISSHTFTVNDIAIAIKNELPIEYLTLLLAQTPSITEMPVVLQERYLIYKNLADMAVAKHNIALLKLLEDLGVQPTNEAGVITALDFAIANLPKKVLNDQEHKPLPDKYLNTINYLIEKGYKAHGTATHFDDKSVVIFSAPNGKSTFSSEVTDPKLKATLTQIELLNSNDYVHRRSPDGSLVSKAIQTMASRKQALNNQSESCAAIRKDLTAEEGFVANEEVFNLIQNISKNGENTAEQLHEIDPVLVNLWQEIERRSSASISGDSHFITLLRENEYQRALEYSATQILTTNETDALLLSLTHKPAQYITIWNARVSATPPTGLFAFRTMTLEKWQFLMNAGFNFSLKDKSNNDIFVSAVHNTPEVVQLLLNNGYLPNFDQLGVDALDALLNDTYEKGLLNPNFSLISETISRPEPSHLSRVARIKQFFPEEYKKLVNIKPSLTPSENLPINKYRLRSY